MWRYAEREASGASAMAGPVATPGRRTLVEAVQRAGHGEASGPAVHAAAARGTATPSAALPFGRTIQQLFGRHDVSGVQAHTGPEAAASARAMNAGAYAVGDHVVLGDRADLHTVAHEAAHVVQQRAGVYLQGGVGAAGDAHEQHADAVADRVVRGESAEALLDRYAGGRAAGPASVQRKWVDKRNVNGTIYARWQQTDRDLELRDDGWYASVDGALVPVDAPPKSRWEDDDDGGKNTKRKLEVRDKSSSKDKDGDKQKEQDRSKKIKKSKPSKKPKAPVLSDKIGYNETRRFDPAFTLITESEIGARILARALENTDRVVFTLESTERTQTHLKFGDMQTTPDRINVNGVRAMNGPGTVAQHLVMELTNLSNKMRFWALDYQVQQDTLSKEDYVIENERIEYEAACNVYGAWKAANDKKSGSWGECNYKNPEALASWSTWWAHLNQSCQEHLNHYREAWDWWREPERKKLPPPPTIETQTETVTPTETQTQTQTSTVVVLDPTLPKDNPFNLDY